MSNGKAATAEKAAEKRANAASEDVQADIEALRDDVTRLAQQLGSLFTAKGDLAWRRAKGRANGVLNEAEAARDKAVGAARDVSEDVLDTIDESLKQRPYTTLGLALALGFVVGAVWRR
jgi:ElaB/YqjD/DUF883 family membrane-anchored ribosome-binding protein